LLTLYTFFRSSAAYRVRIALNYKGIAYEPKYIWLPEGEHLQADYARVNPQALVPTLVDGPHVLNQSLAIIEYLDETHPGPKLLPADAIGRARARSLAQLIACEIHPINNLRVLKYLRGSLRQEEESVNTWYRHWVSEGLAAYEKQLQDGKSGAFSHGDALSIADLCLVPQIYNANRFKVDLSPFPQTMAVHERLLKLSAVIAAQPDTQPDAARLKA
jgi:maleylpyruvate isomerase